MSPDGAAGPVLGELAVDDGPTTVHTAQHANGASLQVSGSLKHIGGVLFDVDDTLVDTHACFAAALSAVAEEFLPDLGRDQYDELLMVWRRDSGGFYRAYTRGEIKFREQRMHRANELHARFGGPILDDASYDAWTGVFDAVFLDSSRPFPDAEPLVTSLLAQGKLLGALSNAGFERQVARMALAGLHDQVPMLVGTDTLGFGKPDPRVFEEACRRLGTEPEDTLYVGDELDVDASGALDAGLVGVWLDRPGSRRGGHHLEDVDVAWERGIPVVSSLTELGDLLGVPQ